MDGFNKDPSLRQTHGLNWSTITCSANKHIHVEEQTLHVACWHDMAASAAIPVKMKFNEF